MRLLSLCFLVAITSTIHAQVQLTVSYDKNWALTTPSAAAFTRNCLYDTATSYFAGPVIDFYANGKRQMIGNYEEKKKNGDFIFYYEDGSIETQGKYKKDLPVGIWKSFFPDGHPRQEIEFFADKKRSPNVLFYNDSTGAPMIVDGNGQFNAVVNSDDGKVTVTGHYKNGCKDGEWMYKATKKDYIQERYKDGKFIEATARVQGARISTVQVPDFFATTPYKLIATEAFAAAPGIGFETYPALNLISHNGKFESRIESPNDNKKVYMIVEQQPEVNGGMAKMVAFIRQNLHYPAAARKKGIEGSVFVEFIIDKDGNAKEYKVLKSLGYGCDEEAVRVLQELGAKVGWKPGMQNGKPVRVRFVIPVRFAT